MKELKNILKTQSLELKSLSKQIKEIMKAKKYAGILQVQCLNLQHQHRLLHIAYSMNRGRIYEQIEQKTRKEKVLTNEHWEAIRKIQTTHQNVRVGAEGFGITV